uniref:Sialidase domain-containing protein n=1 Tax=Steinernema glaseri TaxID=37863 RepID=A0A1I8ASV9_9BILA
MLYRPARAASALLVNGWSLQTGKKLMEIPCPWKLENVKTDIPVALYADNWVGRHNAVVLAWRNELRTFELPLYP